FGEARSYGMQPSFPVDMDVPQCCSIGRHVHVLKCTRCRTVESATPEASISATLGRRISEGLLGQAGCSLDGPDRLRLVAVLDCEASVVNECRADACRVRNLAGAIDCDQSPVASFHRPRLPSEAHFFDDPATVDAGNDARCEADISGIGAVQQGAV